MARGGARPGAGRKRKEVTVAVQACELAAKRSKGTMTPLDFMLALMRDEEQDLKLRMAAAQIAAPYVHVRPSDVQKGKKEQAEEAAKSAGAGTEWGDDLGPLAVN